MIFETQEKNPLSLRISVTSCCQLQCLYCKPDKFNKQYQRTDNLSFEEIVRFVKVINNNYGLNKVHITGGEPLMRTGIVNLIEKLSGEGIENIVLTTNGQMLKKKARKLKMAGLKRINISLDSLNQVTFRNITQGGELNRTLAGIEKAIECGFSLIKLNAVVLRRVNDHEIVNLADYGIERNCQVRFLELMPIGVTEKKFQDWFVPSKEVENKLIQKYTLKEISGGVSSSSRNFFAQDNHGRTGIIGFISPYTAPFCDGCRRLRLTAEGKLIGCLALNNRYEIRSLLESEYSNDTSLLMGIINTSLNNKRRNNRYETHESMASIGG